MNVPVKMELEAEDVYTLHKAVTEDDPNELSRLVSQSYEGIDSRDESGLTPLHIAIEKNNIQAVKLLLAHGADPNLQVLDDYGELGDNFTAVCLAVCQGNTEIMRLLMNKGGLVTPRAWKMTAEHGRMECVKALLAWVARKGSFDDGTSRSEGIGNALTVAALGWRKDTVKILLESGAIEQGALNYALLQSVVDEDEFDDFDIIDPVDKRSPESRKMRVEVVKMLLDAGADVNSKGPHDGMTALHKIGRMGSRTKEIFELLLERGADVNARDVVGRTPLFYAVLGDDLSLVMQLVERGASATISDNEGYTPLHVSSENLTPACTSIVSFLLGRGASPSEENSQNETPLHHACRNGNAVAVKVLLDSNPDLITAKSSTDWTALHFAADRQRGCAEQCIDVSKILLDHGADINEVSDEGWTVLHRAIVCQPRGAIDFVAFLLDNGADVNATAAKGESTASGAGDTPLHLAVIIGEMDIMNFLLNRGADIEARDSSARTPLLKAVILDEARDLRPDIVVELIKRGADTGVRDENALSFEDLVEKKGWEIVRDGEGGTRHLRKKGDSNSGTGGWGEYWMESIPGSGAE